LTNSSTETIAAHASLETIHLINMPIDNAGVAAFAGKPVKNLVLDQTAVNDESFATFATITGLESLNLDDCHIAGTGLKHFADRQPLLSLSLAGNPLTEEGFKTIAGAPCTILTLSRTALTDEQLLLFVDRDDLTLLDVSETTITEAGVKAFYEARKRRLRSAGKQETLHLLSEFPETTQLYYDAWSQNAWGQDSFASPDFEIDGQPFSVP
jgi:hypothetical protein